MEQYWIWYFGEDRVFNKIKDVLNFDYTEFTEDKLRLAQERRLLSPEARLKMSESHKGSQQFPKNLRKFSKT